MKIVEWFKKTLNLNVSPVTYIVFIAMFIRGVVFSFESGPGVSAFPFSIFLAIGAAVTLIGFAKEKKNLVSSGSMVTFLVEVYAMIYYFSETNYLTTFTVAGLFALTSAYVYWTNAVDRLWGYAPLQSPDQL